MAKMGKSHTLRGSGQRQSYSQPFTFKMHGCPENSLARCQTALQMMAVSLSDGQVGSSLVCSGKNLRIFGENVRFSPTIRLYLSCLRLTLTAPIPSRAVVVKESGIIPSITSLTN